MQSRRSILLSLVCAAVIVCAPPVIHASQQNVPPPDAKQAGPPAKSEMDAQRTVPGPYRLTYTLTEMDANKKVGTQHYTLVLDADMHRAHTSLQTHVPVQVGATYQIEHIGISLDSQIQKFQNGLELYSTLDQTSLADNQQKEGQSGASPFPPVTRETTLFSSALMQENQPVILWKLDIPGSTHMLEVQAELTRVR